MQYGHDEAVTDGVNVDFDVYPYSHPYHRSGRDDRGGGHRRLRRCHQVQCWQPQLELDGRDSAFLTTTVPAVYLCDFILALRAVNLGDTDVSSFAYAASRIIMPPVCAFCRGAPIFPPRWVYLGSRAVRVERTPGRGRGVRIRCRRKRSSRYPHA
jgi:hypothetical protein